MESSSAFCACAREWMYGVKGIQRNINWVCSYRVRVESNALDDGCTSRHSRLWRNFHLSISCRRLHGIVPGSCWILPSRSHLRDPLLDRLFSYSQMAKSRWHQQPFLRIGYWSQAAKPSSILSSSSSWLEVYWAAPRDDISDAVSLKSDSSGPDSFIQFIWADDSNLFRLWYIVRQQRDFNTLPWMRAG